MCLVFYHRGADVGGIIIPPAITPLVRLGRVKFKLLLGRCWLVAPVIHPTSVAGRAGRGWVDVLPVHWVGAMY
jgi:hypothetical protein